MKFKVGDKVRLLNGGNFYPLLGFKNGGVYEVIGETSDTFGSDTRERIKLKDCGRTGYALPGDLELIESRPTKRQLITALEEKVTKQDEEIAELKLIVNQLRESNITIQDVQEHFGLAPSTDDVVEDIIEFEGQQYKKVDRLAREGDVVIMAHKTNSDFILEGEPYKVDEGEKIEGFDVYRNELNRTPETVDVYELIIEDKPKTANELRGEIIEKAKQFIEDTKETFTGRIEHGEPLRKFENVYSVRKVGISKSACNAEFIVNEEKRTIVALLRGVDTNKVHHRGIAKCMPGYVFNSHIGKAIALGRALGLDVSEFEQAVQPTKIVKGTEILFVYSLDTHVIEEKYIERANDELGKGYVKIINDTNAIYSEVK